MLSPCSGEVGGAVEDLFCAIRYGRALSMILIDGGEVDEDSASRFIYTKLTPRHKNPLIVSNRSCNYVSCIERISNRVKS